jgi:hypothetical protein
MKGCSMFNGSSTRRDEPPSAWRVWFAHYGVKLTSSKRPPNEFGDFPTEEEALNFKRSLKERFPHSVACIECLCETSKARAKLPNGRQRTDAGKAASQSGPQS